MFRIYRSRGQDGLQNRLSTEIEKGIPSIVKAMMLKKDG